MFEKLTSALLVTVVPTLTLVLRADDIEPRENKRPSVALDIGDAAIDFSLPGVDGKTYTLKNFAGAKIFALIFTCNHCPTAQAYEDRIIRLVKNYAKRGVAFVAISPNDPKSVRLDELGYTDLSDSLEDMKLRAQSKKFNFPYIFDGEKQQVSRRYGPTATPQIYLFDADRHLRYRGRIDSTESGVNIKRHDAREALDDMLRGADVRVPRTRVFGCSIKWSSKRGDNEKFLRKLAQEKVSLETLNIAAAKKLRKNDSGKLRLINVWATYCGPCRTEFPDLVETFRMYRHRNFDMVTITIDGMQQKNLALKFLKKQQASTTNYIYGSDELDAFADALDERWSGALPISILVKPGGKILYRHEGKIDALELRRKIVGYLGRIYAPRK